MQTQGVTIPPSAVVDWEQFRQSPLAQQPFVLKPRDGGSSIDTLIATNPSSAMVAAESLFRKHHQLLLQELIVGTEITVAILGDMALPVVEIIPPTGEEFDYENKYNGKTQELCPPVSVSKVDQAAARQVALTIHQHLGVRHLSRTDMIIDQAGTLSVLELNTIPGLTEVSLYPKAARVAGMAMPELVNRLIQLAVVD